MFALDTPTVSASIRAGVFFLITNSLILLLRPYQIGRTCAIFNVDEIVVFDDGEGEQDYIQDQYEEAEVGGDESYQTGGRKSGQSNFDPGAFLARVLQYLETPQ